MLIPGDADSQTIKIELRLVTKVAAGTYTVKFDFNWNSAEVKPPYNDTNRKGTIAGFNLNSYLKDMKDGTTNITVDSVPAFLFVNHPSEAGWNTFKIKIDGVNTYTGAISVGSLYTNVKDEDKKDIEWLESLTTATDKYEFAEIFKKDTINYAVTPPTTLTIKSEDIGDDKVQKITANLVIVFPMAFKFSGTAVQYTAAEGSESGNFLRVKFADLDKFLDGDSGSEGVMQQIEEQLDANGGELTKLELKLSNIKNTVIDGLYLAIASEPGDNPDKKWHIIPLKNDASANIKVNTESLASLPQIRFLLPANGQDNSSTGALTVKPLSNVSNNAFNVNISVVAGISLDKTIDL
jgi:hypothetical protein